MQNDHTITCWVLTDGKAGDEAQCIGVAQALGCTYEVRRVNPRAFFAWFMPRGPVDPREAPDQEGSPIAPPYPDLVIASGRRSVAYLKRVRRESGGKTLTVFLKDPRTGAGTADLIWVPEHDGLRGNNVLVSVVSPHRFSAEKLARSRTTPHSELDALSKPRIAVLVGGDSKHHHFTADNIQQFMVGLKEWETVEKASFMITTSRRTPEALKNQLAHFAQEGNHFFWDGKGVNPLTAFFARADAVVATADSTNMVGEASCTGKPVHVFHPTGGHRKITRFLGTLEKMDIVHPFPGALKDITYTPQDPTREIAVTIRRTLEGRKKSSSSKTD